MKSSQLQNLFYVEVVLGYDLQESPYQIQTISLYREVNSSSFLKN